MKRAVIAAVEQLVETYGSQNKAAQATGIGQQTISTILKGSVGLDSAEKVAAAHGQTLFELEQRFATGDTTRPRRVSMQVRVGDLPGWATARREAEDEWGSDIPKWAWRMAENVRLPATPPKVNRELAYALAQFVKRFCQSSGIVRVDRRYD